MLGMKNKFGFSKYAALLESNVVSAAVEEDTTQNILQTCFNRKHRQKASVCKSIAGRGFGACAIDGKKYHSVIASIERVCS